MPCLNWFESQNIPVAVLTNGNANLTLCSILGPKLTLSINAQDVGSMKPSPVPFIAVSQQTNVPPRNILFIGDSFESDVKGSANAGMIPAWIQRAVSIDPIYTFPQPTIDDSTSSENGFEGKYLVISSLEPTQLISKLADFLRNVHLAV